MHAEHVPLSATAKRLRLRRLRLGVTRGVGAAMASCTWSDEETFVLIEIWGEDSIQAMLEGTRRNKDVFVKIAKAIEERGFLRAILYTYYGIPLRMRKYTHSAPFYFGNPFGLCNKAGSQYDAGNSVALRRASTSYCEHDFAPTSVDARCDVTLRSS